MKELIQEMLRERLLSNVISPENEIFAAYNGRYLFNVTKAYEDIKSNKVGSEVRKFNPDLLRQFSHPEFTGTDPQKLKILRNQINYDRPLGILVNFRNPDTGKTEWTLIDGNHRTRIAAEANQSALLYVIKNPKDVDTFMRVNRKVSHELFPLDENKIKELATKVKAEVGRGTEHTVYSSNKYPNRLFKIGKEKNVAKWLPVFRENPEYFPKVFRVGKLRDNRTYVEIEKLYTDTVLFEWDDMDSKFEELSIEGFDVAAGDSIDMLLQAAVKDAVLNKRIQQRLIADKNIYTLYMKWITFLIQTQAVVEKYGYRTLDIHRYNYGYSADRKIKCLDI